MGKIKQQLFEQMVYDLELLGYDTNRMSLVQIVATHKVVTEDEVLRDKLNKLKEEEDEK